MPDASAHPRMLIAGNWKMNGLTASLEQARLVRGGLGAGTVDVLICPPVTLIAQLSYFVRGSPLLVGAQDCHPADKGAHTGDVSAPMLADAGAKAVIVGHSERRIDHGETDELVRRKAEAAHRAGLTAIVCVGETLEQRRAGDTLTVVARQLDGSTPDASRASGTVVAYEPVWAIGTGLTPTPDEVAEVHARIRDRLVDRFGAEGRAMRILYGGSVNPGNAATLLSLANVDGALVGGASLKAADFLTIIQACPAGRPASGGTDS